MQIQQIKIHKQEIEISKSKIQITPTANPRWFVVNVCKNIISAMIFQPQCNVTWQVAFWAISQGFGQEKGSLAGP